MRKPSSSWLAMMALKPGGIVTVIGETTGERDQDPAPDEGIVPSVTTNE